MSSRLFAPLVLSGLLVSGPTYYVAMAQDTGRVQSDASPAQRVSILRSRLETMRRSLNNAAAAINAGGSGDKKDSEGEDAAARLRGLEKEAGSLLSEVSDIQGKIDRSEKVETEKIGPLETATADLQTRVDGALQATAGARIATGDTSASAPASKNKKKKGKLFGLLGGGGENDKYADLTSTVAPGRDRVLFEDATHEVRKGNQETGRLLFNTIITTYPDSAFLPLAKLAIADSFYLEGTTSALIQAASAYQDWLTFFPTDPLADRVMLKMAECEMRQMGLPDRQITKATKAEQRLKVLLQQFPETSLKTTVQERLNEVQENLAMHSYQVGNFYMDRQTNHKGGLKGAQGRYLEIVEKYPNFSYMSDVLYKIGVTYVLEEEPDEAAKYFQRVVRDFPNCQYVDKAKDQLELIGAKVPDPDPVKKNLAEPERPSLTTRLLTEMTGAANVTVDKNGVLISKGGENEGKDLIDQAIANKGQVAPTTTPTAPVNRRAPARTLAPQQQDSTQPANSTGAQLQQAPAGANAKPE
jgi:outer membrane protein assembly factor BamD